MRILFWTLVIVTFSSLIGWFALNQAQPRNIRKIGLSAFASPAIATNAVAMRLREEFRKTPIWLWGINPQDPFHAQVVASFFAVKDDWAVPFDELWLDEEIEALMNQEFKRIAEQESTGLLSSDRKLPNLPMQSTIQFKQKIEDLAASLQEKQDAGKRVLVLTVTPYAATFLEQGPAWALARNLSLQFQTLVFADLPRRRELEAKMTFPCVLSHSDRTGIGDLGCRIVQRARLLYRKKMSPGSRVGVLDQYSKFDFLFLTGLEPGETAPNDQ